MPVQIADIGLFGSVPVLPHQSIRPKGKAMVGTLEWTAPEVRIAGTSQRGLTAPCDAQDPIASSLLCIASLAGMFGLAFAKGLAFVSPIRFLGSFLMGFCRLRVPLPTRMSTSCSALAQPAKLPATSNKLAQCASD